jgi:phosphoglycolate phosphatase-like HAD superfamily hydrolase
VSIANNEHAAVDCYGTRDTGAKYRAVLFDFDGTLTPSLPLWVRGYRIALHSAFGLELSDDEIIERCFFRDWSDVAADLGIASVDELRMQVLIGVHEAFLGHSSFRLRDRCSSTAASMDCRRRS